MLAASPTTPGPIAATATGVVQVEEGLVCSGESPARVRVKHLRNYCYCARVFAGKVPAFQDSCAMRVYVKAHLS
jgi:hypothetical protein